MKEIKNIIVPIDFSVTSRNAYQYARNLARKLDSKITVVNIKQSLVSVSDNTSGDASENTDSVKEIEKFIIEEDEKLNVDLIQTEAKAEHLFGNVVDVLVDLSDKDDYDLIVMGSSGLQDILEKISGSISHKVSNKAHCPVILVPREVKWHTLSNIMFASNFDSLTDISVKEISSFASEVSAEIHFVNVKNFDPLFETKQKEVDWDKLNELNALNNAFHKHTIYGNDTANELNNYSKENNINMMAFLGKHRNFWENLMHKSVTENIVLFSEVPLMIIHLDDKS